MNKPTQKACEVTQDVYQAVEKCIEVPLEDLGYIDRLRLQDAVTILIRYVKMVTVMVAP